MTRPVLRILTAVLGLMLFLLSACARRRPPGTRFATPDEAAKAVLTAFKTDERTGAEGHLRPRRREGPVLGRSGCRSPRPPGDGARHGAVRSVEPCRTDRQELVIGDEQWPFPVPLTKVRGGWQFDTDAGRDEILSRRIGRNELQVIDVCRDYVAHPGGVREPAARRQGRGPVCAEVPQRPRTAGWFLLESRRRGDTQSVGRSRGAGGGGGLRREQARARSPSGVSLPGADGPGSRREGRRSKSYIVNGEMSGGFGLDRLSGRVRPRRHHDLHREPGRGGLSEGPGRGHAQGGRRARGVRP